MEMDSCSCFSAEEGVGDLVVVQFENDDWHFIVDIAGR